jgi:hypothetical protein
MFLAAWLVLFIGLFTAVSVNSQGCGTWGLTCFAYAFFIALGTVAVAAVLFWYEVTAQATGTAKWYWALGMACLMTVALATGMVAIATVVNH